ncbi:RNase P modulator RnpM [Atopobacter phocae]|uniref:RNase P modulator RnpM n=1 Tax=Atopobacter phocae TaxID=136492 RepID=UPI00046F6BBD|nr:YlxR family protein [Atopobacter phocae]
MKQRKIPMRRCVVSQEMFPKKELVRIVRTPEQEIKIDSTGKMNGRGAYIAIEPKLVEKARKHSVFEQHLKVKVPQEFYDELYAYLDHQKARLELFKDEQ